MTGNDALGAALGNKNLLRQHYIEIRRGLGDKLRAEKNRVILSELQRMSEIVGARHVFSYISYGFEPDTHELINWLHECDIRVSIPTIMDSGELCAVEFPGWHQIVAGPKGIPQPEVSRTLDEEIDVCITPAICYTESGYRLGYGAGFYDRWFNAHDVSVKIGITFEDTLVQQLPIQDHDIPVDIVVSEKRIIRVR
jgi:5-formyltetrahydrofolate cyclo-ligase